MREGAEEVLCQLIFSMHRVTNIDAISYFLSFHSPHDFDIPVEDVLAPVSPAVRARKIGCCTASFGIDIEAYDRAIGFS
jgi:hypothetical protein